MEHIAGDVDTERGGGFFFCRTEENLGELKILNRCLNLIVRDA